MPARAHHEPHGLTLRFDRDGTPSEVRYATDGQAALLLAVALLVDKRTLMVGEAYRF